MKTMPPNFEPKQTPITPPERPSTPPPMPSPLRQGHSMPIGEQHVVDPNNLPKVAGQNLFQSESTTNNQSNYDFIFNHQQVKQPKTPIKLPGNIFGKIGVIAGGIVVIIIIFAVASSVLKGSSNLTTLVAVLQDQQELIHISNSAEQQADISGINKNFAATASLSLSSCSTALQSYISAAGDKVNPSTLVLKESPTTDKALSTAEEAGDFNSTYSEIAEQQLTTYINDLKTAYSAAKGPEGRALLLSDFNQAKTLLNGLNSNS
jgi:hypothetical protein